MLNVYRIVPICAYIGASYVLYKRMSIAVVAITVAIVDICNL